MNFSNQFVAPAIVIAIGFVLAAALGAGTFYFARSMDNVLSVTGSSKMTVTSDRVKWSITVTRTVGQYALSDGYTAVGKDVQLLTAFLKTNGIQDSAVTLQPITTDEVYRPDGGPREINVRQTVVVQSSDVKSVDALSKRMTELATKGVFVSSNWLEFYVSTLPDLRVQLLGDAIRDARARAEQIAKAGNTKVGALKTASSGVVQVLAPNSIDVADYGQYDTQSIEKEVMVTARATFFVR